MSVAFRLNEAQRQAIDRAALHFGFSGFEKHQFESQIEQAPFEEAELILCAADREYFIREYVMIYDPVSQDWIPFDLWGFQVDMLDDYINHQLLVALKARQMGLSWLFLAIALHEMLFRPIAVILLFNKREDEALYLLGEERLRGMYHHLPDWMKPGVITDAAKHFQLANDSSARAFPSNAGDSYSATLAIVDEADLVPDLEDLLRRVKPTIDAGGKLVLISRSDKSKPNSYFKRIYRDAKQNKSDKSYKPIFIPWYAHPHRDQAWYDEECALYLRTQGSLDGIYEQYPATDTEALAPASLHKRIPAVWLEPCYEERTPLDDQRLPAIPELRVFVMPQNNQQYVAGMDCAEGLRTSDDSATVWINKATGEEVANLVGKLTPAVHAALSVRVSQLFNNAPIMVENNNHGHAAILWLNDNGHSRLVMQGHNGKDGWTSNTLGKVLMYDATAEAARTQDMVIHDLRTFTQLAAIEKSTLRAPQGEGEDSLDDVADSFALAQAARGQKAKVSMRRVKVTGLYKSRN